jgi:3-methylcrotonyl-CoA carboxylase alpha subunit
MFKKILIANRGEIACRVAATARRMGVRTVAVYSDADAHSKHGAACDEKVHIGGSAPRESYLQWHRILDAAKQTSADAIHPGYGFLSENEEFAQACGDAGLIFIGPSPAAIRAMGLKAESKRLMQEAGVPLVPGYHGADQTPALLQREADRIGYPVLIKASAGGGGKGMRAVQVAEHFPAALASCQREATGSFGNADVLIEKYVQRPRHIEFQVFGDMQGQVVHLFERDCSVQRRHQKVLEEAPAPGMTEPMRQQMGAAAVAAAKAVDYVGAGTVEFIVEQRDDGTTDFFFMEMNTRLQVEHPVTEAITGLDLVEWQMRIASGEPLPLRQDQLRIEGHAIEARICAENPDNQFLPSTGTLQVYRKPRATSFERAGDGAVRIDDGVREADTVTPYYDSMIAKLIVHGATRDQALARLDAALAATHIVGLPTNVQFLRRVIRSDSFSHAHLDTALIERERPVLFGRGAIALPLAVTAAVAQILKVEAANETADPFTRLDGWRSHGVMSRSFDFTFEEQPVEARLTRDRDGSLTLAMDAAAGPFQWRVEGGDAISLTFAGAHVTLNAYQRDCVVYLFAAQGATQIAVLDPLAQAGGSTSEGGRLTAPMPGKVVSFAVKPGDVVVKGQPLAIIEAMKMEHTIAAPVDGVVDELLYAPGDQVAEGAELLRLAA